MLKTFSPLYNKYQKSKRKLASFKEQIPHQWRTQNLERADERVISPVSLNSRQRKNSIGCTPLLTTKEAEALDAALLLTIITDTGPGNNERYRSDNS
jgi:hypothetical protein